jgi:tRNA U34 5-carboxymethylaminomethyl modifying enzyme MnmG/GidA
MSLSSELKTKVFRLGAVAIDSDAIKYPLWKLNRAIKISAVYLGVDTACAAADTNYNTFKLTDITNDIATIANGPVSGGTTFAAGVPQAMTVVAAQAIRAADDQLQFEVVKTGNGLALAGAYIQIDYYEYDA